MRILDGLKELAYGAGTRTVELQLGPDEVEVTRAAATHRPGGLTSVGGDLVLTTTRLVFTPLDVEGVSTVLTRGVCTAGGPVGATRVVDAVRRRVEAHDLVALSTILEVVPGAVPSLLEPPTLAVLTRFGSFEIGVLATRRSMNVSSANVGERNRMVAAIRAQLGVGRP